MQAECMIRGYNWVWVVTIVHYNITANQPDLDKDISDEDPEVSYCIDTSIKTNGAVMQDPAKDMEAEMVLDCYEKFNEVCIHDEATDSLDVYLY